MTLKFTAGARGNYKIESLGYKHMRDGVRIFLWAPLSKQEWSNLKIETEDYFKRWVPERGSLRKKDKIERSLSLMRRFHEGKGDNIYALYDEIYGEDPKSAKIDPKKKAALQKARQRAKKDKK